MDLNYARQKLPELEKTLANRIHPLMVAELASCYFTLGDLDKAVPLAIQAQKWLHGDSGVAMNLGMMLKDLGRHSESARMVEHAYHLDPDDNYAQLGYAESLLKAGLWKQAWKLYDNARPTQQGAALDLQLLGSIQEWNGGPLPKGHKLLVINEGGTGDRLCYARWLPKLTEMGIDWVFYPYDILFSFFERIFPRDKLIKDGEKLEPDPTHWVTTFALPAKLNVGPNEIPPALSVIADPELVEKYKFSRTDHLPIVGICYKAGELFQGGRKVRSLTEGQAARLICQTGDRVHWVSLQFDDLMAYPVTNILFKTWEETAALIANLDAVVTVDTGIFHLAGAMGKPMAVLLSANSCWKFLSNTDVKCRWYPQARLFRSKERGMEEAINSVVPYIRSGALCSTAKHTIGSIT